MNFETKDDATPVVWASFVILLMCMTMFVVNIYTMNDTKRVVTEMSENTQMIIYEYVNNIDYVGTATPLNPEVYCAEIQGVEFCRSVDNEEEAKAYFYILTKNSSLNIYRRR